VAAWRWRLLAHDAPDPLFNGVTTGLRVEGTLWLGSYQADRLAYRALPLVSTH